MLPTALVLTPRSCRDRARAGGACVQGRADGEVVWEGDVACRGHEGGGGGDAKLSVGIELVDSSVLEPIACGDLSDGKGLNAS